MGLFCWWRRCGCVEDVEGTVCRVEGLEVEAACGAFWDEVVAADYGLGLLVVLQWQRKERVCHGAVDAFPSLLTLSGVKLKPFLRRV